MCGLFLPMITKVSSVEQARILFMFQVFFLSFFVIIFFLSSVFFFEVASDVFLMHDKKL